MAVQGYLFGDYPVIDELKQAQRDLAAGINSLTDASTLEEGAAKHADSAHIEPCTIDRAAAKFDVDETADSVTVTVTIPVAGATRLLRTRVRQDSRENVLVRAEFLARTWLQEPDMGPRIQITETFPPGTTTADVRAKVKESVDAIEANLTIINTLVEEHNASIPATVDRLIEQRRQILQTSSSLRDGLSDGI